MGFYNYANAASYPSGYENFPASATTSLSFESTPSAFPSAADNGNGENEGSSPKMSEITMLNDTKNEINDDSGSTKQERHSDNGGEAFENFYLIFEINCQLERLKSDHFFEFWGDN